MERLRIRKRAGGEEEISCFGGVNCWNESDEVSEDCFKKRT